MTDLVVTSFDCYPDANKKNHHTNAFDSSELILRRGQPFALTLNFNRALQSGENVTFIFETGPFPSESSKTKATVALFGTGTKKSWSAVLTSSNSKVMTVTINSPPDAVIGRYTMSVAGNTGSPQAICALFLLFNPWIQEDGVYLANESERQEYVLNEKGVIFMGTERNVFPLSWGYNQFDRNMLEISLAILDQTTNCQKDKACDITQRHDPLYICRVVHGTLNSKDENGVLVENWSGYYDDAISPTSWNGSSVILKDWFYKGFKPVKYGQCWVYGGLLCTVLRCLGIPTRVVTNFNSAHDKNGNLFIDVLYDSHGASTKSQQDMIWNFHVWNEAWLVRTDLSHIYNGWQVMDATPLELSEGLYRCGPAPLVAIKEGDVDLKYDVGFMFASVNADVAYWMVDSDGTKKRISNDTKYIGKKISTKAVGSNNRVDVTHTYKYPEGTPKEREIFDKAVKKILESSSVEREKKELLRRRDERKPKQGSFLSGSFTVGQIPTFGQDVNVILGLKNGKAADIRVTVNMTASSILYTGKHKHEIWADAKTVPLRANEEKHISIPLTYAQYGKYVSEDNMIRVVGLCEVEGAEERILVETDISLGKPPICIQLPSKVIINKPVQAEVLITNTLPETLNSCTLVVEGSGLVEGHLQKDLPPLKPGIKVHSSFKITPSKIGTKTLIVTLNSDKIRNVKGYCQVFVDGSP